MFNQGRYNNEYLANGSYEDTQLSRLSWRGMEVFFLYLSLMAFSDNDANFDPEEDLPKSTDIVRIEVSKGSRTKHRGTVVETAGRRGRSYQIWINGRELIGPPVPTIRTWALVAKGKGSKLRFGRRPTFTLQYNAEVIYPLSRLSDTPTEVKLRVNANFPSKPDQTLEIGQFRFSMRDTESNQDLHLEKVDPEAARVERARRQIQTAEIEARSLKRKRIEEVEENERNIRRKGNEGKVLKDRT